MSPWASVAICDKCFEKENPGVGAEWATRVSPLLRTGEKCYACGGHTNGIYVRREVSAEFLEKRA